jgi:hypothetical protein
MGEGCEKKKKKKKRWVRGDVCVWWGRRKEKGRGYMDGGEKKKRKKNGEWVHVYGEKKNGEWKKKEEKKLKRKKLNWFYLYVHFIWYKV